MTDDAAGPTLSNGSIDLRKTHPTLYRVTMVLGVICILLGVNFYFLTPTFQVYDTSYFVWASVFTVLGASKIAFLNARRNLRLVRAFMALTVTFLVFFGIGTMQPWIAGEGSLQLPILYMGLAFLELPLLIEPFLNPWTARRD